MGKDTYNIVLTNLSTLHPNKINELNEINIACGEEKKRIVEKV